MPENEVACNPPAHRKIKKFVFKISQHNIHIQEDRIQFPRTGKMIA